MYSSHVQPPKPPRTSVAAIFVGPYLANGAHGSRLGHVARFCSRVHVMRHEHVVVIVTIDSNHTLLPALANRLATAANSF